MKPPEVAPLTERERSIVGLAYRDGQADVSRRLAVAIAPATDVRRSWLEAELRHPVAMPEERPDQLARELAYNDWREDACGNCGHERLLHLQWPDGRCAGHNAAGPQALCDCAAFSEPS